MMNKTLSYSSFGFLSGSAASRVDLKPGDQLVAMDDTSLAGLDHSEIIKMIQKVIYTVWNVNPPLSCL